MIQFRSVVLIGICLALVGCQRPGQNAYAAKEVGKVALARFGVIVSMREVDVIGKNTGLGVAAGAAVGGGAAGAAASGSGRGAVALVGAAIGAVGGGLLEQAAGDRKATEFIVTLESKHTVTIVQDNLPGDAPLKVGDRVLVQLMGKNQRVLPAADLPTEAARPAGIKLVD